MYQIVEKKQLNATTFSFWINAPEIAKTAKPGQFLHVMPDKQILRRPISICEIEGENVRFVMDVVGAGTREIAEKNDSLDVVGPFGKGFKLYAHRRCLIIGGGIGSFPLLQLAKETPDCEVILGFRSPELVLLEDDFKRTGKKIEIVTKGFVTDIAREIIDDFEKIYACGPKPMLKAVAELAEEHGKWCEVSLEERMACGVGACVGCVAMMKNGEYKRVCADGPVFRADEVDFNERAHLVEQAGGCNGKN